MAAILDERWSATWVEARAEVTLPSARRAHRRTEPRALNAAAPASAPADVTVQHPPASNHQPKPPVRREGHRDSELMTDWAFCHEVYSFPALTHIAPMQKESKIKKKPL